MRAQEFTPRKLVIFDIDDTLVHTQTKVHVVKDGRVIKSLNSHDFTHYKLQDGEKFDFGDFANAQEFFNNAKPIIPMLDQLKQDIATGNKVVMVTARADFDDRELFLDTFRKYGVDMGKVHVYRAGNMQGKMQTEEKKKIIIRDLLNKGNYTKAIMYDDAVPNLESFVELKDEYPNTKFYAWNVSLEGEASEYHRTNEAKNYPFAGAKVGQKAGVAGQLRGNAKQRKDGKQPAFNKLVGGS
jgi:FMN phosphatase YigB (HAD superfamily)